MKSNIFALLIGTMIISGCGSSQKITGFWSDPGAASMGPYNKAFVVVMSQNPDANYFIEDQIAKVLISKGYRVTRSTDIFPPKFSITQDLTREQLTESIKKQGCDAVMVLALLDTRSVETYNPGTGYYPMNYGYYGSYYSYYNYYYPTVYSPGYWSSDKTYYLETNLYEVASDKLVWSIQSEARNPSDLNSWFREYSYMLINHLKGKGLTRR